MASKLRLKKKSKKRENNIPNLNYENRAKAMGYKRIAGIDEVGRGPLAGPVVAACVVLKKSNFTVRVDDSKKLTPASREKAYFQIIEKAYVGVGLMSEDIVERRNINNATVLAMRQAFFNIPVKPDIVLIDGKIDLKVPVKQIAIIRGDSKSLSIAAASIVAKVLRDRLMVFYDDIFPEYGFAFHKGYGTSAHFTLLKKYGLSPLHRKNFIPANFRDLGKYEAKANN